jgi:acetoacetyl-CoA synthetase
MQTLDDQLPLWTPTPERIANANVTLFMHALNDAYAVQGLHLTNYHDLYDWSVRNPAHFWAAVWDWCGVIGSRKNVEPLVNGDKMPGAAFFPEAKVNFAENLLERDYCQRTDCDAIIFWGEDRLRKRLSHRELHDDVSRWQQAFVGMGLKPGDRVAAFMPNMPETVVAMLAATSLGCVWTSCSPDFGTQGVVDRFGQVTPRVLIACDGYIYNGKPVETLSRVGECAVLLPSVEKIVIVPYLHDVQADADTPLSLTTLGNVLTERVVALQDFLAPYRPKPIAYTRMPFNAPLYIMYSSGTTGVPKCIVHGIGGTLLKHLEEHILQCDVKRGDRVFFFTTCGWMMWNWLVSGLAANATLVLFDGSPFMGRGNILFDYAAAEDITHFGAGAKFYESLAKIKVHPGKTHALSELRAVMSTGSPLSPEGFEYIYANIKHDVCLSSISGGTDIIGCFVGGVPVLPVYRGEIQTRMLGMSVDAWDDEGHPIRGDKGELVCTKPFPSMPIGFWDDADGRKYRAAYFEHFPNVWTHGDYVEITERGGMVIYGRSDAVLNPGGVRIGTAEIYRQVEKLDEVLESVVIGQDWPPDKPGDVRVVLFVRLAEGVTLDAELEKRIREMIRANTTPRHVPAKIVEVSDVPRTKSGKIVELAVRNVVHGRPVKNKEALANPDALAQFAGRVELSS